MAERLRDLDLAPGYDSGDDALASFYVPVLRVAVRYDRSVGYFRSTALAVAARGVSRFIARGGRMRLLAGTDLTREDCEAMAGRIVVPETLAERLVAGLATDDDIARRRLEVLAWLCRTNRLSVRLALPVDADGRPVPADGYFHEKIGVLRDEHGEGVAFQGSVNESDTAWTRNFESFSVYRSWEEERHFELWSGKFDAHWAGRMPGWRVVDLPAAVRERLLDLAPHEAPDPRDPEEPAEIGDPRTVARFLLAAPTMVGAERLAEATSGVRAFPHQQQVAERLAGEYPRSWLVADEVGLGKTISAGLALRRLVLDGRVRRALVLAPASVCRQWQDELFEKFGLWVPRYDRGQWLGVHPSLDEPVEPGGNPYRQHDIGIVSSHLARRRDHQQRIVDAGPWDLVIVDEAHHARRRGFADLDERRPSRLLELLDRLADASATRATWLLTATPMQVHPVELLDLLRHVGLTGALAEWSTFERWHAELQKPDEETSWAWLASVWRGTQLPPLGPGEAALLDDIERRVGPVARELIERFGASGMDAERIVEQLGDAGRTQLRRWLRAAGPVGRFVTRHSRATLHRYRARGLLREPIATRNVTAVPIDFTPDEARLYKELDGLLDRLMERAGTRRGAGFVLTVYRRRLTSSWAAIRRTLERRLHGQTGLDLDDDLLEEAEIEVDGGQVDADVLPLFDDERTELERYLSDIDQADDSKFDQLQHDIDEARARGRAVIVFTQFTDTLDHLRERLRGVYRSELATFTSEGGRVWDDRVEDWVRITRQELVEAVRTGRVRVLIATDSASEGLNLQACSWLINYDMPWNPMRVEQRIGRIDRIGQQEPVVEVRNYFIPGTVEERVYELLAERIDDFSELLGGLQPILGATEDALRNIFRAPRSERSARERKELDELARRLDELRTGGIELSDEDLHPGPPPNDPPVTLEQLDERLRFLGVQLGTVTLPATADPDRVSRDAEDWCALATYGHPRLVEQLTAIIGDEDPVGEAGGLVIARDDRALDEGIVVTAAARDDRRPPDLVHSVTEIGTLGSSATTEQARRIADETARAEAIARLERLRATKLVGAVRRAEGVRQRFVRLVHRVIATECTLAREERGEIPVPSDVWQELIRSGTDWRYAEAFRQRLDLDLDEVAPARLADPSAFLPGWPKRHLLHETAPELRSLMDTWRSLGLGALSHGGRVRTTEGRTQERTWTI